MRRLHLVLVAMLIGAIGIVAAPSAAGTFCYRVRVAYKGLELADTYVPFKCKTSTAVSVTTERVGDTTVETTRYTAP